MFCVFFVSMSLSDNIVSFSRVFDCVKHVRVCKNINHHWQVLEGPMTSSLECYVEGVATMMGGGRFQVKNKWLGLDREGPTWALVGRVIAGLPGSLWAGALWPPLGPCGLWPGTLWPALGPCGMGPCGPPWPHVG